MIIQNGLVLTDAWAFECLDLTIEGDLIADLTSRDGIDRDQSSQDAVPAANPAGRDAELVLDAAGLWVIPGLIDIHIHGCAGFDFCDADLNSLEGMACYLARRGVTSFLGTSMALSEERLADIFRVARQAIESGYSQGAQLRGIHMEGPFFAVEKNGAQPKSLIQDPDLVMYNRLQSVSGNQIRIMDIAPERPGALDLIRGVASGTTVSIAHTTADYDTALNAFEAGAKHVTHLFNAMPPFAHRSPGVIGAASDAAATVEIICDGIHLHPSVVRSVFKWFGAENVVLVSDAIRACGLPNGHYELGEQVVTLANGRATTLEGSLAGSAIDLMQGLRLAVSFGIPLNQAVRASTGNPAKVAGIDSVVGSISVGKKADLLLVDQQLNINAVVIRGQVFQR